MTSLEVENQKLDDMIITIEHLKNALNNDLEQKRYSEDNIRDAIETMSDYQGVLKCFKRVRVLL